MEDHILSVAPSKYIFRKKYVKKYIFPKKYLLTVFTIAISIYRPRVFKVNV